jgi:hypothetical protein
MALQSDVARDEGWFIGEDKRIRFTVYSTPQQTAVADITTWTFVYELYAGAEVAFAIEAGANLTVEDGPAGIVIVAVDGDLTAALPDLTDLHHVLRRTNAGERSVIAYGDVVLIDPSEV